MIFANVVLPGVLSRCLHAALLALVRLMAPKAQNPIRLQTPWASTDGPGRMQPRCNRLD